MAQRFVNQIIAVDFDGTCVEHEYPFIGVEVSGCLFTLDALVKAGHNIVLYTMRSDEHLQEAVDWFTERRIPLWGINSNPQQFVWTNSPKVYAHIYIDDAALGCPTIKKVGSRPVVDWAKVHEELQRREIIS